MTTIPSRPTFGLVSGRPLFLDLRSDSYFLLEDQDEAPLLQSLETTSRDDLVSRATPSISLERRPTKVSLATVWRIWSALRRVRRDLAKRSLATVLEETLSIIGAQEPVSYAEVVSQFEEARRYLPAPPNCLCDSIALLRLLRAAGAPADLIFGAKLDPFAAHCWLEHDGLLLNDRVDRIEAFTPVGLVHG